MILYGFYFAILIKTHNSEKGYNPIYERKIPPLRFLNIYIYTRQIDYIFWWQLTGDLQVSDIETIQQPGKG